jgi:hypothetical protein
MAKQQETKSNESAGRGNPVLKSISLSVNGFPSCTLSCCACSSNGCDTSTPTISAWPPV